jgi:hypothetical protein
MPRYHDRLHQILKIKGETKDSLFYLDPKYLEEILADLGEIAAHDIADDKPYNILEFLTHLVYIGDITIHQQLYLAFKLGQNFGRHPTDLEEMIMLPYIARSEKQGKV